MTGSLPFIETAAGLVLAPLMVGIVNQIKAFFGGRIGPPLLQRYRDIWKLLHKGVVYSPTTTWLFRAAPVVVLSTTVLALSMVPWGPLAAPLHFGGDLVAVLALMGLGRFTVMLAALDTGSSFEGMGASREAHFAALVEPVVFLALSVLLYSSGETSLSSAYRSIGAGPDFVVLLTGTALFATFLVENSRIPVDDPATHLELTMIHEVMTLDHSGPDLAFIEYAAALKLWVLGCLIAGLFVPASVGTKWAQAGVVLLNLGCLSVVVGVLESTRARLRLNRVPEMIVGAGAIAVVACILTMLGKV